MSEPILPMPKKRVVLKKKKDFEPATAYYVAGETRPEKVIQREKILGRRTSKDRFNDALSRVRKIVMEDGESETGLKSEIEKLLNAGQDVQIRIVLRKKKALSARVDVRSVAHVGCCKLDRILSPSDESQHGNV